MKKQAMVGRAGLAECPTSIMLALDRGHVIVRKRPAYGGQRAIKETLMKAGPFSAYGTAR